MGLLDLGCLGAWILLIQVWLLIWFGLHLISRYNEYITIVKCSSKTVMNTKKLKTLINYLNWWILDYVIFTTQSFGNSTRHTQRCCVNCSYYGRLEPCSCLADIALCIILAIGDWCMLTHASRFVPELKIPILAIWGYKQSWYNKNCSNFTYYIFLFWFKLPLQVCNIKVSALFKPGK